MEKAHNRLSSVEKFITIVVVCIISFAGWYIWRAEGRGDSSDNSSIQAGVQSTSEPLNPIGPSIEYSSDSGGVVMLQELGISIRLEPELITQGLMGVPVAIPSETPAKSMAFTTQELARNNKNCDGVSGWIGIMTRYEGAAAAMPEHEHEHTHGSTIFDYGDFHIIYQTVIDSCVAATPGYKAEELGKETIAARQLWSAMQTAEPL